MALQKVVVHFPSRILKNVDSIASQKKLDREQAVVALVEESLQRNRTRKKILRAMRQRQTSPEWNKTFKRIERLRAKIPAVPEAELETDIQEAVIAVHSHPRG